MRWAAVLAVCTTTLHWPVLAFVGTHTGLPAASLHLLAPGGQPGAVSRGAWRGAPSRCAAEDRAVAPTRSSRRVRCQAGGHGIDGAGDFRFPVRQFVRDDWPGPGLSLLSVCVCVRARCCSVGLGGSRVVRACVHACACLCVPVRVHVLISLSLRGCSCVFLLALKRERDQRMHPRARAHPHTHTHTRSPLK